VHYHYYFELSGADRCSEYLADTKDKDSHHFKQELGWWPRRISYFDYLPRWDFLGFHCCTDSLVLRYSFRLLLGPLIHCQARSAHTQVPHERLNPGYCSGTYSAVLSALTRPFSAQVDLQVFARRLLCLCKPCCQGS
jgi:hypothetical protein